MRIVAAGIAIDQQPVVARGEMKLSRAMPAMGLKADPVVRRQFEQWQFTA